MKVRDLKKILAQYPDDTEIFIYNEFDECDGLLDRISYDSANIEINMYDGEEDTSIYSPYYCKGDSEAEQYWGAYGPDKKVLFLRSSCLYYDFEEMRKREEILNELSRIHY